MINCLIVDDEVYAIDTLCNYIRKTEGLHIVETFTKPSEVVNYLQKGNQPDLVFMDIDMPELTGFDLAKLLPGEIPIIYVTALGNYALQSFETNVLDFLLKPVSFNKFLKTVNKAKHHLEFKKEVQQPKENEYVFVNPGVKGKLIKIVVKDIIYVEGLKNYICIYTLSDKHITYLTMHEIELALPESRFLRVHKSYLINIEKIKSIDGNKIYISEKIQIPIGPSFKEKLTNVILEKTILSRRNT